MRDCEHIQNPATDRQADPTTGSYIRRIIDSIVSMVSSMAAVAPEDVIIHRGRKMITKKHIFLHNVSLAHRRLATIDIASDHRYSTYARTLHSILHDAATWSAIATIKRLRVLINTQFSLFDLVLQCNLWAVVAMLYSKIKWRGKEKKHRRYILH